MTDSVRGRRPKVAHPAIGVLYAVVMIVVIVSVDLLFFRDLPWARLASNIGIVLVFGGLFMRFFVKT